MNIALEVLLPPFVACLVLTGIHTYLGLHVVSRGVIFVDLALAQIAALGATFAFLLGYDPHGTEGYLYSLAFAFVGAAIFSISRLKDQRIPQEAIIGITFAVASAAAILIADRAPQGSEFVEAMLTGALLWVPWPTILKTAGIYIGIGVFHWIYRKRFLMISLEPGRAESQPWSVRWWDFLFYTSFGFVITSSVAMAGILLVFSFLVIPSVIAMLFSHSIRMRLVIGWTVGTLVSMVGLSLSYAYDFPSGPAVVCTFGFGLILAAILRYLLAAEKKLDALARVGAAGAVVFGALWLAFVTAPLSSEGVADAAPLSDPSRAVGGAMSLAQRAGRALAELESSTGAPPAEAVTSLLSLKEDVHRLMLSGEIKVSENAVRALARAPGSAEMNEFLAELAYHASDLYARQRAAEALLDRGDILGVEATIELLDSDAPAFLKAQASEALEKATGQDIAFDPQGDEAATDRAIAAWRAWWEAHRETALSQREP